MNEEKLPNFVPLTPAGDVGQPSQPTVGLTFEANVQKPSPAVILPDGSNDPTTDKPGVVTVSILSGVSGNVLLVQVQHADGDALGLFLGQDTLAALRHCLDVAERQLIAMANVEALRAAGQKPS